MATATTPSQQRNGTAALAEGTPQLDRHNERHLVLRRNDDRRPAPRGPRRGFCRNQMQKCVPRRAAADQIRSFSKTATGRMWMIFQLQFSGTKVGKLPRTTLATSNRPRSQNRRNRRMFEAWMACRSIAGDRGGDQVQQACGRDRFSRRAVWSQTEKSPFVTTVAMLMKNLPGSAGCSLTTVFFKRFSGTQRRTLPPITRRISSRLCRCRSRRSRRRRAVCSLWFWRTKVDKVAADHATAFKPPLGL